MAEITMHQVAAAEEEQRQHRHQPIESINSRKTFVISLNVLAFISVHFSVSLTNSFFFVWYIKIKTKRNIYIKNQRVSCRKFPVYFLLYLYFSKIQILPDFNSLNWIWNVAGQISSNHHRWSVEMYFSVLACFVYDWMIRSFLRRNHLFLINFTSASSLLATSDLLVQIFYEKQNNLDRNRLRTYRISLNIDFHRIIEF